jgi:hypothetical protein
MVARKYEIIVDWNGNPVYYGSLPTGILLSFEHPPINRTIRSCSLRQPSQLLFRVRIVEDCHTKLPINIFIAKANERGHKQLL